MRSRAYIKTNQPERTMNDTPTYAMLADMRALIAERELIAATELWSEARADAEKAKAYKKVLKTTNANLKRERDEAVNNYESAQLLSIRVGEQRDMLADLTKQFIAILDITEESDSGRLFHPTNITSCRAGDLQKIRELVEALRRASKTTNPNEL